MERLTMNYLDVSPMIVSLRTRPDDFEINRGWLHHVPSRHRFKFDSEGNVRLDARCDCSLLAVKRQQGQELWIAYQEWRAAYWRPVEINKEFASHFRPPNIWQRLYRRVISRIRRAILANPMEEAPAQGALMVPVKNV
jgi:hypothetical protein